MDIIKGWQQRALAIVPPEGSRIQPTRGGLTGAGFFPEGLGLQYPTTDAAWPSVIAVGHNFGCEQYRNSIEAVGREDTTNATWRALGRLLRQAGSSIDCCFMTNWFVGLQPGDKQIGDFLLKPDSRYEGECRQLLVDEITTLRPTLVLLMGQHVVARAKEIIPELSPWAGARSWRAVDRSAIGPVAIGVAVAGTDLRVNVVALTHPAMLYSNQRHRLVPHAEMVRRALNGNGAPRAVG